MFIAICIKNVQYTCIRIKITFERTNLSFEGSLGNDALSRIVSKNKTDMISAIEQHDVGCLEKKKKKDF